MKRIGLISKSEQDAKKRELTKKPKTAKKFLGVFYMVLAFLAITDFFIPKHPYFSWDGYPTFFAAYGFVACIVIVLGAKYILRNIVTRDENYYD